MPSGRMWLGSGLMVGTLVLMGMAVAQPPEKKGGPPQDKKGGPPQGFPGRGGPGGDGFQGFGRRGGPGGIERALGELKLTDKKKEKAEAIVKAYEENVRKLRDLARSDLLQKLKDVLSEQELKTFTAALDRPAARGGFGRGPGGPGGAGRGAGGRGGIERALDDLKLTDKKKEKAEAIVKAYEENVRKLVDLARSDLLQKMKEVLSEQELKTFTAALDRPPGFGGPGGPGGPGRGTGGPRGPGAPGGRGPGGPAAPGGDGFRGPFGRGGPVGIERALDDLKLTDKKKEKAEAIVKAHEENVRKLMDLARSDLLLKMKDVLSEQEFKTFQEALNRQPGPGGPAGPGGPGRGPGGFPAPGGPGRGFGSGGGFGGAFLERIVKDLDLTDKQKDKVKEILTAQEKKVREVFEKAREGGRPDLEKVRATMKTMQADLLKELKGVLTAEQLKKVEKALESGPGGGARGPGGPPATPPGPGRRGGDRE